MKKDCVYLEKESITGFAYYCWILQKPNDDIVCDKCQAYKTEKDLVNGKCLEHEKKPEFMSEEAYFFKLSKYRNKLVKNKLSFSS